MAAGGPRLALERVWRYISGDANWEGLQPALRERMLATAETFFDVELGSYERFLPDDQTLAAIVAPVMVLVSEQSQPCTAQAAGRLAQRLGVEVRADARLAQLIRRPSPRTGANDSALPQTGQPGHDVDRPRRRHHNQRTEQRLRRQRQRAAALLLLTRKASLKWP